jgi:hypothetical protein
MVGSPQPWYTSIPLLHANKLWGTIYADLQKQLIVGIPCTFFLLFSHSRHGGFTMGVCDENLSGGIDADVARLSSFEQRIEFVASD